jgi:hypothetical protein
MAKKPETVFKERVLKDLKEIPRLWAFKVDQRVLRGIPDIVGFVNGWGFAIELKKSKKDDADPLQSYILQRAKKAGAYTWVAHPANWQEILTELRRLSSLESTTRQASKSRR